MSRQLRRKFEQRKNKHNKKNVPTPAKTGLNSVQIAQIEKLMQNANSLFASQQFLAAEKIGQLVLGVYSKHAGALQLLGDIAAQTKKYDEAAAFYKRALGAYPDNHTLLNNCGLALKYTGDLKGAMSYFNKSLRLQPDHYMALNNKAGVLNVLGQLSKATDYFEKAVKANPGFGKAYYNLAYSHKFKKNDRYAKLLEKVKPKLESFADNDKMNLHYAFGRYYEAIGEYEQGFSHYLNANKIKRQMIGCSNGTSTKDMKQIRDLLPIDGIWSIQTDVGSLSDVPIFIVGMPRSGTTLTEQILASHPEVYGAGELKFVSDAISGIDFDKSKFFPENTSEFVKFKEAMKFRGDSLASNMQNLSPNHKFVTDKMPQNFRYVGLLHMLLPHSKIIHCKRNPVDTCLSNFRVLFDDGLNFSYDLEELGKYYLEYSILMDHWEKALPGRILSVQYEDVVDDVETQAKRIIEHCGLEWDEACLEFYNNKRNVNTASTTQVRQPIYSNAVGRYEKYGDLLSPLLNILKPVL